MRGWSPRRTNLLRLVFRGTCFLLALLVGLDDLLSFAFVLSDEHFRAANIIRQRCDRASVVDQLRLDFRRVLVVIDHTVQETARVIDAREEVLVSLDELVDDLLLLPVGFAAQIQLLGSA